ncbi:MAG: glycosyltransferase family 4 protein [Bacteroidota bacterium]
MKKVLIISYTFPPNPGIGGRRWAKFAKELVACNTDVRVLTFSSDFNEKNSSEWTKDISSYKDRINYQPSRYPKWLDAPKSVTDKIMYRLSLLYVKLFARGNYYDKASFLRKKIINEVQEYINNGYTNVIVTCAPFKLAYWVSDLIERNTKVNFIVDFRDPWTNNLTSYGFNQISKSRIEFEKNAEKAVVTKFNKVFVVAEAMKNYFVEAYKLPPNKIEVISNGFDTDDFMNISTDSDFKFNVNDKKKVVFTGTFYNNSFYLLKELSEILNRNISLKNSLEFHFFGTMSDEAKKLILLNRENMFFHGNVKLQEVYSVVRAADFCSLFLTDDITYSLSTKFLEYLSQKKQILVFSKGGATGSFVENNNLGFSITYSLMEEKLLKCLSTEYGKEPNTFYIEEYDIKHLTQKVSLHLQ